MTADRDIDWRATVLIARRAPISNRMAWTAWNRAASIAAPLEALRVGDDVRGHAELFDVRAHEPADSAYQAAISLSNLDDKQRSSSSAAVLQRFRHHTRFDPPAARQVVSAVRPAGLRLPRHGG